MCLLAHALAVLQAASPSDKVAAAQRLGHALAHGAEIGTLPGAVPDRPSRPAVPKLVNPRHLPRRGLGKVEGRIALLHAVAHIEFNAIDLAADLICRFTYHPDLQDTHRYDFVSDWISVCTDEARHFTLITDRLTDLGACYGNLPAHDGLWMAALATRHDFAARLAIAPMVLEARGLDVTPAMIKKLKRVNDLASCDILQIIYDEEIAHVAAGAKWFSYLCARQKKDEKKQFHSLVKTYFSGVLKPPFNTSARDKAGLAQEFYLPLTQGIS